MDQFQFFSDRNHSLLLSISFVYQYICPSLSLFIILQVKSENPKTDSIMRPKELSI